MHFEKKFTAVLLFPPIRPKKIGDSGVSSILTAYMKLNDLISLNLNLDGNEFGDSGVSSLSTLFTNLTSLN